MQPMGAPREIHAAAAAQLEGALGLDALVGAGGLSPDRRQTFALRLDRYWPDLASAVAEIHPDPEVAAALLARLVRAAATTRTTGRRTDPSLGRAQGRHGRRRGAIE